MAELQNQNFTAFRGQQRIASGPLLDVALKIKEIVDEAEPATILIFDDATARQIELDFRGSAEEFRARIHAALEEKDAATTSAESAARRPGRPKLGVVGREITLLPRHWEWLNAQPGGASVALRKLVEEARRTGQNDSQIRRSRDATYRFMTAMAGDEAGFEEAMRALYAGDQDKFVRMMSSWPDDVREYAAVLARDAFS